ncbi:MAG: class I SAM-dependent methyltransferase [Candidatus Thermoplasmatota archaeon]|jgi:ubiquinone/menaquinone biosynthesis C-methylase UbiE|nr:class I SAM-dependent methyltransferase [Candidatus Thermoplasmatota archaeon]
MKGNLGAFIYSFIADNFHPLDDLYGMMVAEVLLRLKSGKVLDVGTGTGRLPMEMVKIEKGLDVTGIDVSQGMIKNAVRRSKELCTSSNVNLLVADVKSLPFDDCVFDLVISSISFHYWKEPVKSLMELYRVTKEGGECWIYDAVVDIEENEKKEFIKKYGLLSYCLVRSHIRLRYRELLKIIQLLELSQSKVILERKGFLFRIRMIKSSP